MANPHPEGSGDSPSGRTFSQVAELFHAALDRSPEKREGFVRQSAASTTIADEVLGLLAAAPGSGSFMSDDPARAMRDPVDDDGPDTMVGRLVAGHRILRRLAAGGMGVVYEAQQQSPQRIVAIKIVRPELVSPETLRRFRKEADLLGRLQHPGIAAIFEAGTFSLEDDPKALPRPYCAMELVHGRPIDEWADMQALSVPQRLELLAQVCDAVEHAHRRGVVHRDIKTANILVGQDGRPKVLDFGIALAVDTERGATMHTSVGRIVGTLGSMSPEQLAGNGAGVDARSDVYSLGVLAYEVLAGRPPFDLGRRSVAESIRLLTETRPPLLGTIRPDLRGDIAVVVQAAMEQDPARRHSSAAALAADLRACIERRPIQARPPSRVYLARTFVRRHRVGVAGICGAFLLLLVATVATGLGWKRAAEENTRSKRVNQYLAGLIDSLDPGAFGRSAVPLSQTVDAAAAQVDLLLADEPEIAADLHQRFGDRYLALGEWRKAERHHRQALALRQARFGDGSLEVAESLVSLARALRKTGDVGSAAQGLEQALAIRRTLLSPDDPSVAEALNGLATALSDAGTPTPAIEHLQEAVRILESRADTPPMSLLQTRTNLAAALFSVGRTAEAVASMEAVERGLAQHALQELDRATILRSVASISMHGGGTTANTERLLREVLEIRERVLPPSHADVASAREALFDFYRFMGRREDAAAVARAWLAHPPPTASGEATEARMRAYVER